jgi:hypothetical protein
MVISEIDSVVREYLLRDSAETAAYEPASGDISDLRGVEVLKGLLYQYRQTDTDQRAVNLQVFAGGGDLVAQLWDQEVKVLLRVASMQHPALPEILNGGHLDADKVNALLGKSGAGRIAYIRTLADTAIDAEDIDAITEAMHDDPVHALRQFWLLADALAILHDARIAHRNLWPGTLQAYEEEGGGGKWGLRLSRFEMSVLLSNILRGGSVDAAGRGIVRALYQGQDPRALRYGPPERLRFQLQDAPADEGTPADGTGLDHGDVFSLGMIVAEWFLGGFSGIASPKGRPHGETSLTAMSEFHSQVRRTVRRNTSLPSALGTLIEDMLDPDPRGRPTAAEVLQRISKNYHGIVSLLEEDEPEEPRLLLYLPETAENLVAWGWLDDEQSDPQGRDVARKIEEDLRGALVVESPDGAEPYVVNWRGSTPEKLRQARWVLVGAKAAWFCRPYELKARAFRSGELLSNVYVISYVAVRDRPGAAQRLRRLEDVPLQRRIGSVRVESDQIAAERLDRLRRNRPDWSTLFETVAQPVYLSPKEQDFAHAIDFLLEYQGAQLAARTYAFQRDPGWLPGAASVVLHWDRQRDQERRDRLPALHAKLVGSRDIRPPFAQFFEEIGHGDGESQHLLHVERDDSAPGADRRVGDFRLLEVKGEDTVVLESPARAEIPDRGFLSPAGDSGTRQVIRRQADARHELIRNRILVSKLIKPIGIKSAPDRWKNAAGELQGEGALTVVDMLCNQLIYALQGPPGTGKTEVSSQAVWAQLHADPQARILVSAQSHYALDNLAVRILRKLKLIDEDGTPLDADFLAIRVFGEHAHERVDERLREFQVSDSAIRLTRAIRRRVRGRLHTHNDIPKVRQVAESWLTQLDGIEIELGERLRRGANLVFVTCSAATREMLVDNGSREPFDWVIIEEAAKAWPTELALPLVRGLRWTMVGDQQQIGAFGREDVERFLNSCADDPNAEIAKHYSRKTSYLKTFEVFGTMINETLCSPDAPVGRLTEQRRMHDPICQVVSRSFYPAPRPPQPPARTPVPRDILPEGILRTMRPEDGHMFGLPDWLEGSSLVWLDTSGMRQDEGYWCNQYEAAVVNAFAAGLRPSALPIARSDPASRRGLAILTPYRHQADVLRKAGHSMADAVKTVDSFQGREADIVIVSLVRDTMRAPWDRPLKNIGHLADPNRVNVMLSRARDLLVIVGSFQHFADSGLPCWSNVTEAVRRFGLTRPASAVLRHE